MTSITSVSVPVPPPAMPSGPVTSQPPKSVMHTVLDTWADGSARHTRTHNQVAGWLAQGGTKVWTALGKACDAVGLPQVGQVFKTAVPMEPYFKSLIHWTAQTSELFTLGWLKGPMIAAMLLTHGWILNAGKHLVGGKNPLEGAYQQLEAARTANPQALEHLPKANPDFLLPTDGWSEAVKNFAKKAEPLVEEVAANMARSAL